MNFEDALPGLREGKMLYNTEFDTLLKILEEKNNINPEKKYYRLVNESGCNFEIFTELLLSNRWNIVE